MSRPRFRFADGDAPPAADAQFWRDCEASERLGSRFNANLFLRELCRSRAWDGAAGRDPGSCATAERRLLSAVAARGFVLSGPDGERGEPPRRADAG